MRANTALLVMWAMVLVMNIIGACVGAEPPGWVTIICLNAIVVLDKIQLIAEEAKRHV